MEDLNKELEQITNEIEEIDKKLDELAKRQMEREDEVPFGLFSFVGNTVKLELLMDVDLFKEEDLKRLEDIANDMQLLLMEMQKREKINN